MTLFIVTIPADPHTLNSGLFMSPFYKVTPYVWLLFYA